MRKHAFLVLLLVLCLSLSACMPASQTTQQTTTAPTVGPDVLHTVEVRTIGGDALEGAAYYLYKDAAMQQFHGYGTIGSSGQITFMAPEGSNYVLKLEGIEKISGMSEGYDVQPSYTITSTDMKIVLTSAPVQGKDPLETGKLYSLGDVMRDFTVTDTEGNSYTLSEMLKTKKCVVLNFWFVDCDFCNEEFPLIQKAYEKFNKDDVALIALDPMPKDTNDAVAAHKEKMALTFPMASCDFAWQTVMSSMLIGYPTTIIIDRYGRICVAESKPITQEGILEAVVEYFTADDYQQTLVYDMEKFCEELAKG